MTSIKSASIRWTSSNDGIIESMQPTNVVVNTKRVGYALALRGQKNKLKISSNFFALYTQYLTIILIYYDFCVNHKPYVYTMISMCIYYDLYVYILLSLCVYYDLYYQLFPFGLVDIFRTIFEGSSLTADC